MKYRKYIIVLYIMSIILWLNYNRLQGFYDYSVYCIGDMAVSLSEPLVSLVIFIPMWSALIIDNHYYDMFASRVIMHKNKLHIIVKQQIRIVKWAVVMAILSFFTGMIFELYKGCSIFNWGDFRSYYYINTGEVFGHGFFILIITYVVIMLLRFIIWGNIIISCLWYTDSFAPGVFIIMILGFVEVMDIAQLANIDVRFISRILKVDYGVWDGVYITKLVISLMIVFVVIGTLYVIAMVKKEYMK